MRHNLAMSTESSMPGADTEATSESAPTSRTGALLVLGAVVVVLIAVFVMAFAPKGAPNNGVLPPDPAGYPVPNVTLEKLDGSGPQSLASLRGRPLVVNFWASWCTTCLDEAALLGEAEKRWREKGVVFIGIDSSDTDEAARAFERKYGMDYTSLIDRDATQTRLWGVTGYPETFFIDREGRIVSKHVSVIDAKTLEARITEIL